MVIEAYYKKQGRLDLDEGEIKNSVALMGMRERAFMLQGEFAMKSEKQKGTVVVLKVPSMKTDKEQS